MPENSRRTLIVGMNYAPEPTGNAPYTTGLATALAADGGRVDVICTHPHYPQWRRLDGHGGWRRRTQEEGIRVTRLLHYVPRRPTPARRLLAELTFGWRALWQRWGRPDVMVAASPALFATAAAVAKARARRTPSVVWVQDLYGRAVVQTGQGGTVMTRVVRAVEGWTLRSATHVVVAHPRFRAYVCDELGVADAQVTVVTNWSHLGQPTSDRRAVRERLGWARDEVVAVHAGNMGAKQGLELVLDAAATARAASTQVRFVLVGDGNQRPTLEAAAENSPNVTFLDPVPAEELPDLLAAADVLLVVERPGSKDLAVPSKLTSYCAAGRPIVACVAADGITAEATAGYAERTARVDGAALHDAIVQISSDAARRDALAAASHDHWRRHMGAGDSLRAFVEVLAAAADTRR